jgi:hypothetical protein
MTKEQELKRLYEDRDMLEIDIDDMNQELKSVEPDSEREDYLYSEINSMENEVAYINVCIQDLEDD